MNQIAPISPARLPQTYESAKVALAECQKVDECKEWSDKAAALASYARQADDLELEKMAARIRARAIRRAGELLKQLEPNPGGRPSETSAGDRPSSHRSDAARDAGMSPHQAKQAVRVASIPEAEFEAQVEGDAPPTLTALAQQGAKPRQKPDPETWLKGRTPEAFNRALHFVGDITEYASTLGRCDLSVLDDLDDGQRQQVREALGQIDPIHDQIATRI